MKIAIIGTRGIPANYGGFETFAEQLGTRLVARGHRVVVYGRSNNIDYPHKHYQGVQLVVLPTLERKHLDTLANTFLSILHLLLHRADVVIVPNSGNAILSWIPRVFGMPVLMNVDGLEWRRRKWSRAAKAFLKASEWLATWMPNEIVTDAKAIQDHYRTRYGRRSVMIPYGAETCRQADAAAIAPFGLEPDGYLLYVSRLEPENNALMVIEAFVQAGLATTLAVVGGAPYAHEYIAKLKSAANENVRFLGPVYGQDYRSLQQNAYAYVQATEVGGTHPALVEAMGFGNCVLVYAVPENVETAADAAIYFSSVEELADKMRLVFTHPGLVEEYRERAMARVKNTYDWDRITELYEDLLLGLARTSRRRLGSPAAGTSARNE
jgi:glycosyltransferase involved in cell wall biosynthesis